MNADWDGKSIFRETETRDVPKKDWDRLCIVCALEIGQVQSFIKWDDTPKTVNFSRAHKMCIEFHYLNAANRKASRVEYEVEEGNWNQFQVDAKRGLIPNIKVDTSGRTAVIRCRRRKASVR